MLQYKGIRVEPVVADPSWNSQALSGDPQISVFSNPIAPPKNVPSVTGPDARTVILSIPDTKVPMVAPAVPPTNTAPMLSF